MELESKHDAALIATEHLELIMVRHFVMFARVVDSNQDCVKRTTTEETAAWMANQPELIRGKTTRMVR